MVRDRSAKPLCSGSIPLDSLKACRKASLFLERLGKAGSVYIHGLSDRTAFFFSAFPNIFSSPRPSARNASGRLDL